MEVEIRIVISEDNFKGYNGRLPRNFSELESYAEKVQTFIRQAIEDENSNMCSIYELARTKE